MLKAAVRAWSDDYAASMGAALAYYTAFSLAPLLIIVIAVAGLVFGEEAARGEIFGQIAAVVGTDGAQAIEGLLVGASRPASSTLAAITGFGILILGATSVFGELQSSLDRIWRAPTMKNSADLTGLGTILGLIRSRVLSLGMVIAMGFLLLVSLVFGAVLTALSKWGAADFPGTVVVLQWVNVAVSFGITLALFGAAYRILPRVRVAWSDVWMGAFVTAVLFTAGKYLIGLYLGYVGVSSGFGAAGSLILVLAWVYYSAQIFLLGAEFTWVYAHDCGSRADTPVAQPVVGDVAAYST